MADLDPLGILKSGADRTQFYPELLHRKTWGFTDNDINKKIYVGDHSKLIKMMGKDPNNPNDRYFTIKEVEDKLKDVYCGKIGFQYMHIANFHKNNFLREKIEQEPNNFSKEYKKMILDRLLWAEQFENFLDVKYPAQKRFGINGAESFVPLLKEIIDEGARQGIDEFVIGMPHRGRLLFLCTVMRKPAEQIFYEFRGMMTAPDKIGEKFNQGDVKYHMGHSQDRITPDGHKVHLSLFPNPSHLEAVNPVVMGKTKAKQFYKKDNDGSKTCCILIHGDASFSGQGVVYESMALTDLPDYTVGGVIHVVVNNQIGFTTDAFESRSSPYCTDVGRSIASPIFHVNGDSPEDVVRCARIATQFRQKFKKDAIVDMLCFRRYGHNEGDEPMYTQPLMYNVINNKMKNKDTVIENYKKQLLKEGVITENDIKNMEQNIIDELSRAYKASESVKQDELVIDWMGKNWKDMKGVDKLAESDTYTTGISKDTVNKIINVYKNMPDNFTVHRKLKNILNKRWESMENGTEIDWGTAETMAYGSLLLDGIHVRISGQDCERGTFSHRHAVIHEQKHVSSDERPQYRPLSHLDDSFKNPTLMKDEYRNGLFQAVNSNLSECGVLGFEYGYSCENPNSLILWEAQFGDFANGAQVPFDQFISSSETKWLRQSGLVMLLPHGYEGGGPEHSSARIERYLQMCNDDEDDINFNYETQLQQCNWQIANCTIPSNFFHILRRQLKRNYRKPLIMATPKFGLRHHLVTSNINEFLLDNKDAKFKPIITDPTNKEINGIKKIVFCSGKIWINLEDYRQKQQKDGNKNFGNDTVLIRIEQISPFPYQLISDEIKKYNKNAQIIYCQEEPKNMAAYQYIKPRLINLIRKIDPNDKREIKYVGRAASASPATGYPSVHQKEVAMINETLFS